MTDLSKGIIELEGIKLSKNTSVDDFKNVNNPNVDIKVSKHGHTYVKFKTPIVAADIAMYVNVACYTDSNSPEFELRPSMPVSIVDRGCGERPKYCLALSKKWLKGMINDEPNEDSESISYSYEWGSIVALVNKDRDYGLRGGEINIRFRED